MTRRHRVDYRFVEVIPNELAEGVVYIAPEYGAAMHLCLDGCGEKVSTPLSPAQWILTFDGETISLCPSVGSWDLPCRSHYWIRKNKVHWARAWTDDQISHGRLNDRLDAERHFRRDDLAARKRWVSVRRPARFRSGAGCGAAQVGPSAYGSPSGCKSRVHV